MMRTGILGALSATVSTNLIVWSALLLLHLTALPRRYIVGNAIIVFLGTIFIRAKVRSLMLHGRMTGHPVRVLIIGADAYAHRIARRLRKGTPAPCDVISYVRLPGQVVFPGSRPVSELEDLLDLVVRSRINDVVVAVPLDRLRELSEIVAKLKPLAIPARLVVDFGPEITVKERMFQFGRVQMLDLGSGPAERLDYMFMKRMFDICFASLVLAFTWPLLLLIGIAVKLSSQGPILFKQERVGINGQVFEMLKFRTMRTALKQESDQKWTTENDPRRTSIGTFLRKTSLDELPQFYNVLRGDMSVVGPRPERPHFVSKFLRELSQYNRRHALKVGITGWAQVNGFRGDTSIPKRVEYDLYYVKNWSFGFDLRIVFLTVWSIAFGRNAY
jgi:Undecaprenyl-phosphate glucose phosphotransferase